MTATASDTTPEFEPIAPPSVAPAARLTATQRLNHIQILEAESIHIIREVAS